MNFTYFPEVATHHPRLFSPHVFHFLYCNRGSSYQNHFELLKSCTLDPWPTFLVFDYLDILITPITSIINTSLEQGKCPNFFKQAHVTLIHKKSSLDKEIFKKL